MSYIILKAFAIKDHNGKVASFKKGDIGKPSKTVEKAVPATMHYLLKHGYIEKVKPKKNNKEKGQGDE